MPDLQQDCEAIGQAMRDAEAIAQEYGDEELNDALASLHAKLGQGFADHIRPQHPELDWNAIAGNTAARGDVEAQSGGKHEPPTQQP